MCSKQGKQSDEFWISDIVRKVVLGPIQVNFELDNSSKLIDISSLNPGMFFNQIKPLFQQWIKTYQRIIPF